MVSQTFFYVIEASIAGKPFIATSIRTPIVLDLAMRLNFEFQMIVQSCLSAIDKATRKKVERVNKFFGKGGIKFSFLPTLFFVLREARSKEDFIPALFRLRANSQFVEFRAWCRRAEYAWEAQDIDGIYNCLRTIREAVNDIASESGIHPVGGSISHIADMRLLTESGLNVIGKNAEALSKACYSPGMAVIRDFSGYLSQGRRNLDNLESLFEQKLDAANLSLLSDLSKGQRLLHPAGEIDSLEVAAAHVQMEVVMGDKFEGINVSGQGVAVGRGARADVRKSDNAPAWKSLPIALVDLAQSVRQQPGRSDAEIESTLVEAAAKKAESGDQQGAAAILKKSASWVLDLAKSATSSVLADFLKSHLGID